MKCKEPIGNKQIAIDNRHMQAKRLVKPYDALIRGTR